MMIRFFAEVDETSDLSRHALIYAGALCEVAKALRCSLRIVPTAPIGAMTNDRDEHTSRWATYQPYFITPLDPVFVNVVCTQSRWWRPFWTKSSWNVLVLESVPADCDHDAIALYDRVITPTALDAMRIPATLFGPGSRLSVLRDALFPPAP